MAVLIAMVGVASGILGLLYLLFRDERPSDETKKRRKRLMVSNWK
jgi:Tfp pilus assembly protein PilV